MQTIYHVYDYEDDIGYRITGTSKREIWCQMSDGKQVKRPKKFGKVIKESKT